jgi:hypothetical protein
MRSSHKMERWEYNWWGVGYTIKIWNAKFIWAVSNLMYRYEKGPSLKLEG